MSTARQFTKGGIAPRQIKAIQDIPILFFTGYQDPHLLSQADAVKPVGIVDKLDTTENIQQAIVSLLQ